MKRNIIWLSVSLVILLAGGLTMLADNAAVAINDTNCGLLDGDGGLVNTDNTHAVTTSSGNSNMNCQADVPPASSGKAVHWDFDSTGLWCKTPTGLTTDWKETVSAGGQASLTCHN